MKKKTTKTENRSRRKSVESRGKIDRINHDERDRSAELADSGDCRRCQ